MIKMVKITMVIMMIGDDDADVDNDAVKTVLLMMMLLMMLLMTVRPKSARAAAGHLNMYIIWVRITL